MIQETILTPEIMDAVAKTAKGEPGTYHVISSIENGWCVVPSGADNPMACFEEKEEALNYAISTLNHAISRAQIHFPGLVVVHNKLGETENVVPIFPQVGF